MPGPLQTLLESRSGRAVSLPPRLARLYGRLMMPRPRGVPCVISNFVTTLDGVVSLRQPGHEGGSDISGHNLQDRMVMGLLRSVSDVVLIGSGTLRAEPTHLWTADGICPELADDYRLVRRALRKQGNPLTVVVTGSGDVDLALPVFASGKVRTVVLTTSAGARRLAKRRTAPKPDILALGARRGKIAPAAIVQAIHRLGVGGRILLEGGPDLLGDFYKHSLVDEQFLTLSPQVVGRKRGDRRLSLAMGQAFAPGKGRWGRLTDLRRGRSHLFLRYAFRRCR